MLKYESEFLMDDRSKQQKWTLIERRTEYYFI